MKQRRGGTTVLVALACSLLATGGAAAFDLGLVEVHGFLNQSYINTTENNWMGLDSVGGTFEFTETAVNFSSEPVEGLRIGAQLYARDVGPAGNFDVVLDWAVGDYRWRDELGIKVGKVKLPFGLYNEYRDADMARASILLPQGMYPESLRDLINTYTGIGLYGAFDLGGGGDLSYHAYYGTQDLDNAFVIRRFMERGAAAGAGNLPMPLSELSWSVNDISTDVDYVAGLALVWQSPVEGLRFSATHFQSESTFSSTTTYSGWSGQIPVSFGIHTDSDYEQPYSCVGSVEYSTGNLRVNAEYWQAENTTLNTLSGLPFPLPQMPASTETTQSYYVQGAYRFNDWFQLSGYYEEFFPNKDDKDGAGWVARDQVAHKAWRKDVSLAARFDITKGLVFKLEGHLFDGTAGLEPLDNPQGLEKDWAMFLARLSFYF